MLQHSIGKEDILQIADMIIEKLDPQAEEDRVRMAAGLQLYREGRVYNVSFAENVLEGIAQDEGRILTVQLPFHNIPESHCDCFTPGYCEHMAAVLFYAGASFGLVGDIMKRFKDKGKPKDIIPQLKTAKQLLQSSSYEDMNYESWIRYFEKEYEGFAKEQARYPFRQSYFLMNIFEELYMKLVRKAPRLAVLRELFELNAALFSFRKLLQAAEDFEEKKVHSYYKPAAIAHRFIDEVEAIIGKLTMGAFPMAFDELLQETAATVHTMLFSHSLNLQERYFLYRHIWSELLNRPLWVRNEELRIEEELQPLPKHLAAAHLAFLQKKDEIAMTHLDTQSDMLVGLYFYWIDELCAAMQWERVQSWLSFAYKKLKQYLEAGEGPSLKRDIVRLYLSSYSSFAQHTNEHAGYEMIIQELLPYSFFEYNQYLLMKKQYRTWTELQLFMGFETLEGLKEAVREVEKEDREAVLPLYHRAVMQAIHMKNRQSYRLAVRYLKKLRTHYKKLKRTEEWERFITTLSASFSRLRALQEELRKGKLIDDNK
ncbi:SWIM zinc finger family protein [Ectobacillus panaciterrae]|uniref:SWIM zinc finger family protein n=1 Tax=Ectobacillus panaciterrae TaxID=363872 RepID=UPI00041F8432|nr:hypothetical protein [Ectobacillus panaciterrae]